MAKGGAFALKLARLADSFDGLGKQAGDFLEQAIGNIGEATAKRAAELTPRSESSGPHVADGWIAERRRNRGSIEVVVRNRDPRANAPVSLAGGGSTTLLHMLEHGTRPHIIRAKDGKRLVFFWPKIGKVVRAKVVRHPGTRPYAMLGLARYRANIAVKQLADSLRTTIALSLIGRTDVLSRAGGNAFNPESRT